MDHSSWNESIASRKSGVAYWAKGNLSLDVDHTYENLWIKAAIPEVKPEEMHVTVTGNTLP